MLLMHVDHQHKMYMNNDDNNGDINNNDNNNNINRTMVDFTNAMVVTAVWKCVFCAIVVRFRSASDIHIFDCSSYDYM